MKGDDSTGRDFLQDSEAPDAFLVSAATKARNLSKQFGWPILILFAFAPVNTTNFHEALRFFFVLGCPAFLSGLALRMWARGYVRKEGFVTDGPYRYVRNPVELGAILAFAGGGVLLGVKWWCNLICVALAGLYMSYIAISYERALYLELGGSYLRYCQRVRRWIPSRLPSTNRSNFTYSFWKAISRERESLLWLVGYALVFALRKRLNY